MMALDSPAMASPPPPWLQALQQEYWELSEPDQFIAGRLGYTEKTWRRWKSGKHSPTVERLQEIRHRLDVFRKAEELLRAEQAQGGHFTTSPARARTTLPVHQDFPEPVLRESPVKERAPMSVHRSVRLLQVELDYMKEGEADALLKLLQRMRGSPAGRAESRSAKKR